MRYGSNASQKWEKQTFFVESLKQSPGSLVIFPYFLVSLTEWSKLGYS